MITTKKERLRMFQWLLLSLIAYGLSTMLSQILSPLDPSGAGMWPRAQTVLWKIGHLNLAAFLGYWIARTRLGRLHDLSPPLAMLAHAVIMAATMIAFGLAL